MTEIGFPTPLAALDRLFRRRGQAGRFLGGEEIFAKGAAAEWLVLLLSGRLAEVEPESEGAGRLLAVHRPGAVVGGGAILSGAVHRSTVTALRDSEILALPKREIDALARRRPMLFSDLVRIALVHDRAVAPPMRRASILGFVAVCDSIAMRSIVERIAVEIRRLGCSAAVLGAEAMDMDASTLSTIEGRHDYVLMAAERGEPQFTHYCGRQIDRLILVGGAHSMLPESPFEFAAAAIRKHRLMDLVLIQPQGLTAPQGSERWLAAAPMARLFQVREDRRADFARLARALVGRSIGLALSGGGARAYAHVGVLRALQALEIPIDFVAGTSMGAIVAAGWACGWNVDEMEERIRAAFVTSSPLADIAFPILAMTRGREVERRLEQHFADIDISDLWLPFACISTDLTLGQRRCHRSGRLRDALRASISLPGLLPPVIQDGHVLVDGAFAQNLPVDVLRDLHDGPTLGVDVAGTTGLLPEALRLRPSPWRWLISGAWRGGPPIVSVLIRSATFQTALVGAAMRDQSDVLIEPELEGVELQDWKAFVPAVKAGYQAAMAQAAKITQLAISARGSG